MPCKQEIVSSIAKIAKQLGRAPSRDEFISRSGISEYFVLQSFRSWSGAVRAAGLQPYSFNARVEDREMLEDWGLAVRKKGAILPWHVFRRVGKYNPSTLAKRFGRWTSVPEAFRNFAKGKREWTDVVALLPAPVPPDQRGRTKEEEACGERFDSRGFDRPGDDQFTCNEQPRKAAATTWPNKVQHPALKGRAICGKPIELSGLRHGPVNEQGVALLFGMLAKDLGYMIEAVQSGFPDCEAKRQIGPERWQRVYIEFEFESRNYREHGHPLNGCDVIVCWRHNWEECPKHIEVVELSRVVKSLTSPQH